MLRRAVGRWSRESAGFALLVWKRASEADAHLVASRKRALNVLRRAVGRWTRESVGGRAVVDGPRRRLDHARRDSCPSRPTEAGRQKLVGLPQVGFAFLVWRDVAAEAAETAAARERATALVERTMRKWIRDSVAGVFLFWKRMVEQSEAEARALKVFQRALSRMTRESVGFSFLVWRRVVADAAAAAAARDRAVALFERTVCRSVGIMLRTRVAATLPSGTQIFRGVCRGYSVETANASGTPLDAPVCGGCDDLVAPMGRGESARRRRPRVGAAPCALCCYEVVSCDRWWSLPPLAPACGAEQARRRSPPVGAAPRAFRRHEVDEGHRGWSLPHVEGRDAATKATSRYAYRGRADAKPFKRTVPGVQRHRRRSSSRRYEDDRTSRAPNETLGRRRCAQ